MPKLRKCCVVECNSNHETHRLFNFPKNDMLRDLWLFFLVPVNIQLSGLSKSQLRNRYVCQNHFDRQQFDSMGNRLAHGYPCLFSDKEMMCGIPLSILPKNHFSDHTYALPVQKESFDASDHNVMNAENCTEHNYAAQIPMNVDGSTTTATSSLCKVVEHIEIVPDESIPILKNNVTTTGKELMRTETANFVKKIRKIVKNQNQKQLSQRMEEANSFSQSSLFNKNFHRMKKPAQDFLLMHLKMANKKKAMRYTTDEKLMSLSLMKESPKGYRLLQKMFNLLNKRTLNRLAEKIHFGVGINETIINLLEYSVQKWDTKKRLCSILFHEVALTPHLTYNESQDVIRGFKDFGDVTEFKYCDHALVFMIKGICSNWRQPIAYYFCEGTTAAATIVRILKKIVTKVSQFGLIPLAIVCDQGPTNRTAKNMLLKETERKRCSIGDN